MQSVLHVFFDIHLLLEKYTWKLVKYNLWKYLNPNRMLHSYIHEMRLKFFGNFTTPAKKTSKKSQRIPLSSNLNFHRKIREQVHVQKHNFVSLKRTIRLISIL